MKKTVCMIFIFTLALMSCFAASYAQETPAEILLDGNRIQFQPGLQVIKDISYVPLELLCKYADIKITKDDSGYKLTNERSKRELEFQFNSKNVKVNGIIKTVPFELIYIYSDDNIKDVSIVPLTFIVENLGGEVVRDAQSGKITISSYKPITFKDKNLEAEIRNLINKPSEEIFKCDVSSLTTLGFSGKNISEIEGLQYFTDLSYLDLSGNKINDLSPLKQLNNLKTLMLKDNPVSDFSPVAGYYDRLEQKDFEIGISFVDSNLEKAVRDALHATEEDLTLDDLKNIKKLDAGGIRIADLQGIQYLTNLTELDLSYNSIKDLAPLKNLLNLKELKLSFNYIEDIEPLGNLKELEVLYLNSNRITEIDGLKGLGNLTVLYLAGNNILDFSAEKEVFKKLKQKDFELVVIIDDKVFYDIAGHWALEDIKKLIKGGIIEGYNGYVMPDAEITRAQIAVMLAKALNLSPSSPSETGFTDVDVNHWAAGYIKTVNEKGILKGYPDNTFKPDECLTRSEMITAVVNAFNLGVSLENTSYSDKASIPEWGRLAINRACEIGLVNGYPDNTFRPDKNVTRAEVFVVLSKALDLKKS